MNSENPEIDWVAVRNLCSAERELTRLRELAEKNVKTRNDQIPQDRPALRVTAIDPPTQTGFAVEQPCCFPDFVGPHVRFILDGEVIRIRGRKWKTELALDVTVGMDDNGACTLYVNDLRRERWQVLREALEELFFGLKSEDYT